MLLIRPILRANEWRKHRVHVVVFFIFLVANIGGSLTPLGDPPLFLGFLKGIDFFWTMALLPAMIPVVIILLIIFFIVDTVLFRKEGNAAGRWRKRTTPPPRCLEFCADCWYHRCDSCGPNHSLMVLSRIIQSQRKWHQQIKSRRRKDGYATKAKTRNVCQERMKMTQR